MKLPQLSLTTKIAGYFLLLSLITVSIVGGVAYFRAKETLEQAAFDRLSVAATLKEQEITRWFEERQRDFLQTTQMPDVRHSLNILLENNTVKEKQRAYQILTQYLTRVNQINPSLREIFILDRSNRIVFSTNKEREGEYEILANITYISRVEIGANFSPIFYVSPITGKPAITLAKPLEDRSGMILVDLDLEIVDRIVREKTGLGKSGESYLVGSLISKNTFIAGKSQFSSSEAFPDGINSAGIDAAMNGMSGYGLYHNYNNSPVLGVYRWLNEQDIALLVEIDRAEAFAPARKLASAIIFMGSISVFGLLMGVNWLSWQLAVSRKQLERSSQKLQLKAREAEAASKAKSSFLANMSHELRTPLNAILGFSQLMSRDSTITVSQKESLNVINRSGEHLLNLINDVLEMSKIEAGKIILNYEPFDLHRLLQTIQQMCQIKARSKGLWFEFRLDRNLPQYVVSDSRKLRQLLINLLSNAIEFTQSGGVTVLAFADLAFKDFHNRTNTPPSNCIKLCFEVTDTGKGIAPEELNKLFDPFVQTKSGIQSEGGTGLGLAISSQFAKLMGGTIQASSILGEGSTFAFDIQVELADPSQVEVLSPTKQVKGLESGQPNYRIAVVDDREDNRLILDKILQSVGFQTRTATNGSEAIALWHQWQPDLIWMDMRMPVMDGYEATKRIKQQSHLKQTTIIAITASAFEQQKAQIMNAGCDDLVIKPFSEAIIFDKLTQHLGVKFIYQTNFDDLEVQNSDQTVKPIAYADLATLSPTLIIALNEAAIAVDAEKIEQLIAQIPPTEQHITLAIAQMLTRYDFDAIIDLTEP